MQVRFWSGWNFYALPELRFCLVHNLKMVLYDRNMSGSEQHVMKERKKNSVVFSPQANYTDRAIAAGQRS
jgi:hypothetical protein